MSTNESYRLATVKTLNLDRLRVHPRFDALLQMAMETLRVEDAAIAIVDQETVRLDGVTSARALPRPIAFANHVLERDEVVLVEDASSVPLLSCHPCVVTYGFRFVAGAPLHAPNGAGVGALILAGLRARAPTEADRSAMQRFALLAESLLQLEGILHVFEGADAGEPAELSRRAGERAGALATALGARVPLPTPEPAARWTSYDPDLLQLLLRRGATSILAHLQSHPNARFTDILRAVPRMNQRTLATRLKELQEKGLVTRVAFDQMPPRVEYDIDPAARGLVESLLHVVRPRDEDA